MGIVLWADDNFHLVNKINNVYPNPITDVSFNKGVVYTVCEADQGMICYFVDSNPKSIPLVKKPVPRVSSNFQDISESKRVQSERVIPEIIMNPEISESKFEKVFKKFSIKQIALPGGKL